MSAASSVVPSWKVTPSRSLMRQVSSSTWLHSVASRGFSVRSPGVELGERLVDVLQDDPADVGAGRHAGLDDVEFLVQDDADSPVFLGQRGSAREQSRRQGKLPGEGLLHVFLRCSADCCCLGFWLGSDDLIATDNPTY